MISNFESDVKYLQNPSLISQFFSLSNIENVPEVYSFWKWGALFFAIFVTFSTLFRRIKFTFIYLRRIEPSDDPILQCLSEDFDFSDDDDDECSSVFSNDEEVITPRGDRDFSVAGGKKSILRLIRRRSSYGLFPLTEFVAGENVVKLWDLNIEGKMREFPTVPSPVMVFWSELRDERNGVVLAGYDARMRRQSPAISAGWGTGKVVGIDGVEKVYVRDEVAGVVKVGDMRKAKTPVETVTEVDGGMWWNAGAVIVDDDFGAMASGHLD
ncbi:hypothetical protein KY290_020347 [Solanum tuberosum]|uniref:Uncharacterized protein n=1 Tax=Solanum tuberosum TaxID=4113 RepID=A0ABQ7UYE5_SOLTU|nr:hypothetical protein KY290_020347 [Solanum tuberosum]